MLKTILTRCLPFSLFALLASVNLAAFLFGSGHVISAVGGTVCFLAAMYFAR